MRDGAERSSTCYYPSFPRTRARSCFCLRDDEALRAAAAMLGVSCPDPDAEFGRVVEARSHIARDGSPDNIRGAAVRFRARPHESADVAPFLGACCAFVLAASCMTTDGAAHAVNYYDRLWGRPWSPARTPGSIRLHLSTAAASGISPSGCERAFTAPGATSTSRRADRSTSGRAVTAIYPGKLKA